MTRTHAFVIALALTSCRIASSNGTALKVTNPLPATNEFPEVVEIVVTTKHGSFICSGTFVAPDTLVTAAHCFFDKENYVARSIHYRDGNGQLHAGKAFASDTYRPRGIENENLAKDLGIVVFDAPVAPRVATLAVDPGKVQDPVTIVGFGDTSLTARSGADGKNLGTNTIAAVEDNRIRITGYARRSPRSVGPGVGVVPSVGDSGGAMFNARGELMGVISAGTLLKQRDGTGEPLASAVIVALNHPKSLKIIQDAQKNRCAGRGPINCVGEGPSCSIQ